MARCGVVIAGTGLVALVLAMGLGLAGCGGDETQVTDLPEFVIDDESVEEMPIKTQVTQQIIAGGELTEANVRALLLHQYRILSQRGGFKYHDRPTLIGVYVYDSPEKAHGGMGQWVGMLMKRPTGSKPEITIRREVLEILRQGPMEMFGLSEDERRQIFTAGVRAEQRGSMEAEAREPDDFTAQHGLQQQLWEEYTNELAEEVGLTRAQLDSISIEGFRKQWPVPARQ